MNEPGTIDAYSDADRVRFKERAPSLVNTGTVGLNSVRYVKAESIVSRLKM